MADDFKHCFHCRTYRHKEAFAWRNKAQGKLAPFCRACQKEYNRRHYLANKDVYKTRAGASRRRIRFERTKLLLSYLDQHPCVDCGETDPVVLESRSAKLCARTAIVGG